MSAFIKFSIPKDIDVTIPPDASDDYTDRVRANIVAQGYRHVWTDCGTEYFEHEADGTKAYIAFAA